MGLRAQYKLGFYYEQLNVDQKYDYRKVSRAISHYKSKICVNSNDEKMFYQTLLAIKYDNPEFCYWTMEKSNVKNGVLNLAYLTENENEAMELIKMLRVKRKNILDDLFGEKDALPQKEVLRVIFDYLADNIVYAEEELQKPTCSPWIYDISGILLKEKGVCLGIAMTVNYLCQALYIPSILITGEAKVVGWTGNHGWNLVRLDDEYFHLDVTCALGMDKTEKDRFYMVKDKELSDRSWAKTIYPKAK